MINLMHGDCLEKMKDIPDGSVDLVLTDPPYGTTACKWDNIIPFELMWAEIWRVLKPNGACALFGSEPFSSALRMSQIKYFKYDWYWYKNTQTGIGLAKFQPMRSIEIISVFSSGKSYFNPIKMSARHGRKSEGKNGRKQNSISEHHKSLYVTPKNTLSQYVNPRNVLEYKTVGNQNGKKVHPTQKPVALLEYLIRTYTLEGETVLDFTMGSGSTGVACINTNRKFIGIEKEEKYFEIAKERIEEVKRGRK